MILPTNVRITFRMRLFAAVLVLGLPGTAIAQSPGITVQEALQAERYRYAAQNSNNLEVLAEFLADDLVYIHSSGRVDDKAAWLESMRSDQVRYLAAEVHESKVRTYGNTAIVTGLGTFDLRVNGDPRTLILYFTAVYVKQPDGIKLVSWNSTRSAES